MELGNMIFGNSRGEYPIEDRENWQEAFWKIFEDVFDNYGYYERFKEDPEHTTDRGGYENDVFLINPYYWGEDDDIAVLPNFVYKPVGWEIQWYKYFCRDAYQNQEVSLEDAVKIWKICRKSIEEAIC